MEHVVCELNAEKFNKAVHGGLDKNPVLKEGGDLAIYVKPKATVNGNPMAVLTFTVQLPDGSLARAQCSTTYTLLMTAFGCLRGWKEGGHI